MSDWRDWEPGDLERDPTALERLERDEEQRWGELVRRDMLERDAGENRETRMPRVDGVMLDFTLRCPSCGERADMCFGHGDDWKKR